MALVGKLPCVVRAIAPNPNEPPTPCCGEVQVDHAGMRPLGRKCSDHETIPLCRAHHQQRTDHTGAFRGLSREEHRSFRALAIAHTVAQILEAYGVRRAA